MTFISRLLMRAWQRDWRIWGVLVTAICTGLLIFVSPASAHVSQQGFILLLPTNLYIASGTAAVAITVLVISYLPSQFLTKFFASRQVISSFSPRYELALSLMSTLALFALIAIGFWGPHDPLENLLPLFIWTIWWQGILVLQAIFGNLWHWINPWSGIYKIIAGTGFKTGVLNLPKNLGHLPAILALIFFGLFSLVDLAPGDPTRLAVVVLCYWFYTLVGMLVFGARQWTNRAECFTIIFRLFASLAPLAIVKGRLVLGAPGWQLANFPTPQTGAGIFMIMILALGSFDGLNETFWWLGNIGINPLEYPGRSAVMWSNALGLLAALALLPVLFFICIAAGSKLADPDLKLTTTFAAFAACTLPIAVGYHFSHYLTSFMVDIQYALKALSDPFDSGADFLGLGAYYVTSGFLNTPYSVKLIWLTQAAAVVWGHILSVFLAHSIAIKLVHTTRRTVLLQAPLAIFMICYTIFGLWLLASPRGV